MSATNRKPGSLWVLTFKWLDLREPVQDSFEVFQSLEEAKAYRDKLVADQKQFVQMDPKSENQLQITIDLYAFHASVTEETV